MRGQGNRGRTAFGRYQLRAMVGAGTMGTVYRAHDPQLNRAVAVKVLHPGAGGLPMAATLGHSAREARARFVAEARAMAAVSHPNVVQVFDVGTAGGGAFLAMELVQGQTLREWMNTPRPWRDVVRVFVQAGRGLAAAHAHGFVHRDFKPANVLIGRDGRVRVTDFGLVTTAGECESTLADGALVRGDEHSLTQTGMSVGTPAYMSPEQHYGNAVDGRTDQFAFCVALFEALYGVRPFKARTHHDLARRKHVKELSERPPQVRIPAWLESAVLRGISASQSDRFDTMQELLDLLERRGGTAKPARRGGSRLLFAAALAAAAAAAYLGPAPAASASIGAHVSTDQPPSRSSCARSSASRSSSVSE